MRSPEGEELMLAYAKLMTHAVVVPPRGLLEAHTATRSER